MDSSVPRISTFIILLRDSIPGLNLPLYYFTGFQEFLVFEGFHLRYTLVQGFKVLGILESFQYFKCFRVSMLLMDYDSAWNLSLCYFSPFQGIRVFKGF